MIFVAVGTENPAEEEDRVRVAVSDQCGGSYCITQRWIHRHDVLSTSKGIIYIHCTVYMHTHSFLHRVVYVSERGHWCGGREKMAPKMAAFNMCVCNEDPQLMKFISLLYNILTTSSLSLSSSLSLPHQTGL